LEKTITLVTFILFFYTFPLPSILLLPPPLPYRCSGVPEDEQSTAMSTRTAKYSTEKHKHVLQLRLTMSNFASH